MADPTDVETIKIKDGDSYVVINKTAFDPKEHTEWKPTPAHLKAEEKDAEKAEKDAAKPTPAPVHSPKAVPFALRDHIKDELAVSVEEKGWATPEKLISISEDELMNLKMGRRLAQNLKQAAADWLEKNPAVKA